MKTLEIIFVVMGMAIGLATGLLMFGCTFPGDPETTQVVGPDGTPVYNPPGPVERIVQIPPTGNTQIDYYLATVAAAVYGALGFWIRKVKKNGVTATADLSKRLDQVERKAASVPERSTTEASSITMADLVDLLHAIKQQKPELPSIDINSQ